LPAHSILDYQPIAGEQAESDIVLGGAWTGDFDGLLGLYAAPLSAKYLSICDWNVFARASWPVLPRLNVSLSGMYFVDIKSCYTGSTTLL
jgi:hypothetical protein